MAPVYHGWPRVQARDRWHCKLLWLPAKPYRCGDGAFRRPLSELLFRKAPDAICRNRLTRGSRSIELEVVNSDRLTLESCAEEALLFIQIVNPRYAIGRARLAWWEKTHPGAPWLAAEAVDIIDRYLTREHVGLEYGGGRSTVWLGQRLKRLLSVEENPDWHRNIVAMLKSAGLDNVDIRLLALEHDQDNLWRARYEPMPAYVAVADEFADRSLDFCLIDGSYREACIAAAAPKLKPGGLMVLDNMNWRPLEHWAVPPEFRLISAGKNVKTQTGVFVKTAR